MAAPDGTVWGSTVGSYGRIGIYRSVSNTNTQSTVSIQVWFGANIPFQTQAIPSIIITMPVRQRPESALYQSAHLYHPDLVGQRAINRDLKRTVIHTIEGLLLKHIM